MVPPRPVQPRNLRPVPDDEVLTQFGTVRDGFKNEPRWQREVELSTLSGRLSPEEACAAIRRTNPCLHRPPNDNDMARYSTAGTLRKAGFRVEQCGKKLGHVAVGGFTWSEWDGKVTAAFDAAFHYEEEEAEDG